MSGLGARWCAVIPALAALALGLVPASASADGVVVLVLSDRDASALDLERVRASIADALGRDVQVAQAPDVARESLRLRLPASRRVVLELTRVDGSRMTRAAALPADEGERALTIAILAVNMLRDESAELLALLRPPPVPQSVPPVEAPPVTATVVVVEPDPAPLASEPSALLSDPLPSAPVDAAEEEPPVVARASFLRLGADVQLGSVPRSGGAEVDVVSGFELAWTPLPFLALGVRDVGGASTLDGEHEHGGGAPFVELALVLHPLLDLHAQVGADLRFVVTSNGDALGVAPLIVVGARFRLVPEVSIALESALRVVATDLSVSSLYALPALAVSWTGGLALLFHIS